VNRKVHVETERLLLRDWQDADSEPFAAINADPRVMEKIGMTHDPRDDFLHPGLPANHKLAPHVLYRIRRPAASV
jgi:RimJ/RimL family protein N-acetyltransferase